ncbi:P-loop containing nucleoside triphosphate hydrolase protein [Mycena polygramma]|nr:P-loop containing nucleoside triphosphate hydrolase protein [Mycena polygramma]
MASSANLTTTHLPQLRTILDKWNQTRPPSTDFPDTPSAESASKEVIVAFRTRPPLPNEATDKFQVHSQGALQPEGTESVEFCAGISATSALPGVFVAHVPGMKWSGPTLVHKRFEADLGFGPDIQNEEVYQRTVIAQDRSPEVSLPSSRTVRRAAARHSPRRASSTASHETFLTMRETLASAYFSRRAVTVDIPDAAAVFEISVTFLELMGNRASDLLETPKTFDAQGNPVRTEVHIREDNAGNVQPLLSLPQLPRRLREALIKTALSHRRTAATLRNAASSRSHAILTITTKNTLFPYANEGQLILMDLAGSERFEDSKDHNKQRMDEVRENNKGLMNLKECVRAKAKMASEDGFPIFDVESRQPSKAVVIAHVSPHIQDSVHSYRQHPFLCRSIHDRPSEAARTRPIRRRGPAHMGPRANHRLAHRAIHRRPPPPPSADPGVDLRAACPPGATAAHLGRLYTTDFVARCLAARTGVALSEERLTAVALDVVGTLFYMLMGAKNRTRRAVVKSRTKVTDTSLYTPEAIVCRAAQVAAAKTGSEGAEAFAPS